MEECAEGGGRARGALQRSGGFPTERGSMTSSNHGNTLERGSMTSAASTESGIHMGSEHDGANNAPPGSPDLAQSHRLTSLIKSVKRSHSYNVSHVNNTLKQRPVVRPKSLVSGWEQSAISADEILLWQTQLKQLQKFSESNMNLVTKKTKVPKKESLREKARTLISHFKDKRKDKHKGSVSSCESRGTEEDPDSNTSSSFHRSTTSVKDKINNSSFDSNKEASWNSSDALSILKVFAGGDLSRGNAEYRSVLATVDTSVLEVKKQSISKYGFEEDNPSNYVIICATGCYLDTHGNTCTITSSNKDFGSKSEIWRELHWELLNDNTKPLSIRGLLEDEDCSRLEIRPVNEQASKQQMEKLQHNHGNHGNHGNRDNVVISTQSKSGGLHHFPIGCPFLLLIHGYDSAQDNVIYPLPPGVTKFRAASLCPAPSPAYNTVLLHINENTDVHLTRTGAKCVLFIGGQQDKQLKSGECFLVGKHYQFMFKEASEADRATTPVIGSPDTQRTLSTGTLTSLSPDIYLNNISAVIHQHAEPRFIFYLEHKEEVFGAVLNYSTLMHKYPLACGLLTIMCLRHSYDCFKEPAALRDVLLCCKDKIELLAKVAQRRAVLILNNKTAERVSPTSFLKPMMRLLSNSLEILHYMKESQPGHRDLVLEVEKLCVSMFEYVAYHTAKLVYELLPSMLDDPEDVRCVSEEEPKSPTTVVSDSDIITPESGESRRWSMPLSTDVRTRKRKIKMRASLGTLQENMLYNNKSKSCTNINDWKAQNGTSSSSSHSAGSMSEQNLCTGEPCPNFRRRSCGRLAGVSVGIKHLVQLLQKFHNLGTTCNLNNTMIQQLFTSLFFFSNNTLFNTLIQCKVPSLYYNWKKGTQMRINLDYLLKWALQNHLALVADKHFSELNAVLDLLSIPKQVLISSSWLSIARTFPALSPHQLQHLLSNYSAEKRPKCWAACPALPKRKTQSIKMELSAYPQLVIPSRCYKLACSPEVPDTVRSLLGKLSKSLTAPRPQLSSTLKSCSDDVFTSEQIIRCTLHKTSKSGSIGLRLKKTSGGAIMINDIVYSSPAQQCGKIELQDELVAINDISVTGTSVNYCKKIIVEAGEKLTLTISRVTIS